MFKSSLWFEQRCFSTFVDVYPYMLRKFASPLVMIIAHLGVIQKKKKEKKSVH